MTEMILTVKGAGLECILLSAVTIWTDKLVSCRQPWPEFALWRLLVAQLKTDWSWQKWRETRVYVKICFIKKINGYVKQIQRKSPPPPKCNIFLPPYLYKEKKTDKKNRINIMYNILTKCFIFPLISRGRQQIISPEPGVQRLSSSEWVADTAGDELVKENVKAEQPEIHHGFVKQRWM